MEKMRAAIRQKFGVALIATFCLPVGVPCIVFGAIKGWWLLLTIGVVMALVGFYGTPLFWIAYADTKSLGTLLRMIVVENIYTVADLAQQINERPYRTAQRINTLITNGYLMGYLFKDGVLTLNQNQKQTTRNASKADCPYCGGTMTYNGVNFHCDYCGRTVKK